MGQALCARDEETKSNKLIHLLSGAEVQEAASSAGEWMPLCSTVLCKKSGYSPPHGGNGRKSIRDAAGGHGSR